MNRSMILYVVGHVVMLEGVMLLLPCLVSLIYQESEGIDYLVMAVICMLLGAIIVKHKPKVNVFYLKEGCIATALSWIALSIFGALPMCISGDIPSFTDALFETIWRSFTHWIGGMGVLVFLLAVLPLSGGSNINLMKAESPGPSVGKLVPKIKYTARILYVIYIVLTAIEIILLIAGKMPVFHAFCTGFGTAGTGGFGTKNDSFASFSPYLQWVVTIFMILFGVNFNAYYLVLFGNIKKALKMEEVRTYFLIIVAAIVVLVLNLIHTMDGFWTVLRHASFQVASIITTTGFSSVDFDLWNQTCRTILVILMFIGACAGSTGGGIKVSRFIIVVKSVIKELNSYLHPKSIKKIKMDGKPIEHEVVRAVNVYFITFIILFTTSVLLISFEGKDMTSNFTAVAATINNIGPGLELVGPTKNFNVYGTFSKYVLMFDMLAGRLELFPLLLLFYPPAWKELLAVRRRK